MAGLVPVMTNSSILRDSLTRAAFIGYDAVDRWPHSLRRGILIDDAVQVARPDSRPGVRVLSMATETIDVSYLGDQRAGCSEARQDTLKFAEAALTDSKREGLLLAVRARWVALAITAATLPVMNPNWDVIYYVLMLGFFALIGWAQLKVGRVGRSPLEVFLIICDLALLTFLSVVPNPWGNFDWPIGMQFRFDSFIYFFIFLATATLAYSWRTVVAMGAWTAALWAIAVGWAYLQPESHAALSARVKEAIGADIRMFEIRMG